MHERDRHGIDLVHLRASHAKFISAMPRCVREEARSMHRHLQGSVFSNRFQVRHGLRRRSDDVQRKLPLPQTMNGSSTERYALALESALNDRKRNPAIMFGVTTTSPLRIARVVNRKEIPVHREAR
jgi:hypothetical protein